MVVRMVVSRPEAGFLMPSSMRCPECRKPLKLVPILYGYPAPEAFEAERRGELVIAGCMVGEGDPKWACAACQEPYMTALTSDPHFEVVG
jgi:hypothetical protein